MTIRMLGIVPAILLLCPAAVQAQVDADTYQRRPFYTYDLYDALDGYDYGRAAGRGPGGSGYYGGTDYLNYYQDDYYHDPDLYGDVVDQRDWGGYDYLGYDDRFNYDATDVFKDEPDRVPVQRTGDQVRPVPREVDRYDPDPWYYDDRDDADRDRRDPPASTYNPWDDYDDVEP